MRPPSVRREFLFEFGFACGRELRRHFDVMLQMIQQMLMVSEAEQRNVPLFGQLYVQLVWTRCAEAVHPAAVTLGGHQVALGQITSSRVTYVDGG